MVSITVIPFQLIKSYFDIQLGDIAVLQDKGLVKIFILVVIIGPVFENINFSNSIYKNISLAISKNATYCPNSIINIIWSKSLL